MMNIIRADIYRLLHSKAFYITLALTAVFALLIATADTVTIVVDANVIKELYQTENLSQTSGGIASIGAFFANIDNLIYFLIPMFMSVCVTMFSSGTIKNEIASGISRVKMYFAKLLLCAVLCLLLISVQLISAFFVGLTNGGVGGPLTGEHIFAMFRTLGAQYIILMSFTCIGVFLSFVTRRTAAVIGIYIAFCFVPLVLIAIIGNINSDFWELVKYDLTGCLKSFAYIDFMSDIEITRCLLIGAAYIILTTVAGIALFKRAEIK